MKRKIKCVIKQGVVQNNDEREFILVDQERKETYGGHPSKVDNTFLQNRFDNELKIKRN